MEGREPTVLSDSPEGFMMPPDHCWSNATSLVKHLHSSCWEWWVDRTPLLRVSQVPDLHGFRHGKRGVLKSLGLELKVEIDSFHWLSLLQGASLLLLWDDEMSDPQSEGTHDRRVSAGAVWRQRVQVHKMEAKKSGHSPLTPAGKWDFYIGASSHHTSSITVYHPPYACNMQDKWDPSHLQILVWRLWQAWTIAQLPAPEIGKLGILILFFLQL